MSLLARPLFESTADPSVIRHETPPRVSVIVPVTERPRPLDWLYEEYAPALEARGGEFEFLFVVEHWGRELVDSLRVLIEQGEPIRVFEVGQSVGESGMLEAVRPHARGEVILTLPAYPRVLPDGILELIERIESGFADLATALRVSPTHSWFGRFQRSVFHVLLRAGTGCSFQDVASGVRAMHRGVLEEVPVYGDLFRFLPVLAQREGFRVDELPLTQHPDDSGPRVYAPGIYIRRVIDLLGLFFLVRFTRKPLRFFGLIGVVLSGIGGLILLDLFLDRMQGNAVADRPLLLLGVLFFVTGLQAIAMGLIGEIIVHLSTGPGDRKEYRIRGEE